MFNFITKMFRKKEKPPCIIIVKLPEQVKRDSQIIDPSKYNVEKTDVGDMPGTVKEGRIKRSAGHINFNNTKTITRKFKAKKLRLSLKRGRESYYDNNDEIR